MHVQRDNIKVCNKRRYRLGWEDIPKQMAFIQTLKHTHTQHSLQTFK